LLTLEDVGREFVVVELEDLLTESFLTTVLFSLETIEDTAEANSALACLILVVGSVLG
jgi:hypothetical protein